MAITLKLNGKAFDLNTPSPTETKLKAFLDKAPADEIYTVSELCRRAGIGSSTLGRYRTAEYSAIVGKSRYWGNPKAIAELLRQVKHEGE